MIDDLAKKETSIYVKVRKTEKEKSVEYEQGRRIE